MLYGIVIRALWWFWRVLSGCLQLDYNFLPVKTRRDISSAATEISASYLSMTLVWLSMVHFSGNCRFSIHSWRKLYDILQWFSSNPIGALFRTYWNRSGRNASYIRHSARVFKAYHCCSCCFLFQDNETHVANIENSKEWSRLYYFAVYLRSTCYAKLKVTRYSKNHYILTLT